MGHIRPSGVDPATPCPSLPLASLRGLLFQFVLTEGHKGHEAEDLTVSKGVIVNCCVLRIQDQAASCKIPSMKMRPSMRSVIS